MLTVSDDTVKEFLLYDKEFIVYDVPFQAPRVVLHSLIYLGRGYFCEVFPDPGPVGKKLRAYWRDDSNLDFVARENRRRSKVEISTFGYVVLRLRTRTLTNKPAGISGAHVCPWQPSRKVTRNFSWE